MSLPRYFLETKRNEPKYCVLLKNLIFMISPVTNKLQQSLKMSVWTSEEKTYYENRMAYFAMETEPEPIPDSFYRRQWWEDSAFDPKENYPRGVLQEVDVSLGKNEVWSMKFFPDCSEVRHAQRSRVSVDGKKESFKMGLSAYVNGSTESWNLDEISNGEWSGLKPRYKYENMWMKKDINMINEMLEWQKHDVEMDVLALDCEQTDIEWAEEYEEFVKSIETICR